MPDATPFHLGPKAAEIISLDKAVISPAYTRDYPFVMHKGEGAWVWDPDGNRFLDFCAGIAVNSTGHSHPKVVAAICDQAKRFLHMSGTDFYYDVMAQLAERLAASAPGPSPKKVSFGNSGAEAIEAALKLARHSTGRPYIIAFHRAFHGRTYGAMSVTASKSIQKSRFSPQLPGVVHAHYPYAYRDLFRQPNAYATADACLDYIRSHVLKHLVPANEVAAFLVEPVQGEGGYVVPPASFLMGLQTLAKEIGALVIADEVQAGIGRTGKLWASDWFHSAGDANSSAPRVPFEPDMIASAKGLASGLPLGALIAKADVMTWPPGTHASTFGGNPLACAAALATLDLLDESLTHNSLMMGKRLMQQLTALRKQSPVLAQVRGLGLMIGLEIVHDKQSRMPAPALRNQIVQRCFERGLLILGCGESSIRLSPPLTINEAEVDQAVAILSEAMAFVGQA
ncbi:MAG: acetyl ornithine aminotransferase family protein [Vampirovibrionales bacterium]|nr:acetyl ornithine aminotransferase family protein [Vampirovibrionales bacterium]